MMTKICRKCLIYKDLNQFRLRGKYYYYICKDCEKKQKKEYYENNKDKIKEQQKEYKKNNEEKLKNKRKERRKKNKEKINEYQKEYQKNNKEKIKQQRKEYRAKNKDKSKEYYKNNKEQIKEYQKEYEKNRRKNDSFFVLRKNFSSLFSKNITNMNLSKKGNSCFDVLEYDFDKLKDNIENKFEPWMNWNNYGKYNPKTWKDDDPSTHTWNLDHIDPQANLPYKSFEDDNFKKCWSLDNLRPYSAKQNFLDGVSRVRHKK